MLLMSLCTCGKGVVSYVQLHCKEVRPSFQKFLETVLIIHVQGIEDLFDSKQMVNNKSLLKFQPHAVSFIRVQQKHWY